MYKGNVTLGKQSSITGDSDDVLITVRNNTNDNIYIKVEREKL